MNIAERLREQAVLRPDAVAILDTHHGRERATTFAELELAAARGAALLWQSGLRPGDVVLVFQPMSLELYVALIALFRLGLVPMFVDPSAGRAHIEQCCAISPPQAFIGSARAQVLRLLSPALRRIPRAFVIGADHVPGAIPWSAARRLTPRDTIRACAPADPALITFTSGSTGQPRAAVRSHAFLLAQHAVLAANFGGECAAGQAGRPGITGQKLTAEDAEDAEEHRGVGGNWFGEGASQGGTGTVSTVSMTTLPVFVLADLAAGATSLIPAGNLRRLGRINAVPILAQITTYRPARASGSPAFWERIARYCRARHLTLTGLRSIYVGGAPVFPRVLESLHAIAPQAEIVAVYGSTEAEPIAHIAHSALQPGDIPAMFAGRGLLTGQPVPEIELRILRDQWGTPLGPFSRAQFEAQCMPPGQPGEIVVSGTHVLPGYLRSQGDDETKFRVAGTVWHRTGDAGYLDERGRLWLLGRCMARIQDAQGTLYPFAVECAATSAPGVRRAALVAHAGQRTLAVEREHHPAPGTLSALRQLAAWASLDEIQLLQHIPVDRRHNAKVDYPALYRRLARAGVSH